MENDPKENGAERGFDLEQRTERFAREVRQLVKKLPRTVANVEDEKQLVRAPGSVAANDIEANEALSKKDFLMRIKISRKEAKESGLFLRLIDCGEGSELDPERNRLNNESRKLTKIFGSIVTKTDS